MVKWNNDKCSVQPKRRYGMANERPTLNICNTTSNSSVKNVLCEGNVNVTDDGTLGAVNIGDTVEDVIAEDLTFRSNIAFR